MVCIAIIKKFSKQRRFIVNNFFAVDTTTTSCSIYLNFYQREYQRSLSGVSAHAEVFFGWVRELNHLEPSLFAELDLLGLCVGPGRFNGLRVGMTLISTINALKKKPILLCTSHQLMSAIADPSIEHFAIFAKYGYAYYCQRDQWNDCKLVKIEDLPRSKLAVMDIPNIKADQIISKINIKNITKIIPIQTVKSHQEIVPLYVSNLY